TDPPDPGTGRLSGRIPGLSRGQLRPRLSGVAAEAVCVSGIARTRTPRSPTAAGGSPMEFGLTDEQAQLRAAAQDIVSAFDDEYWAQKDLDKEFPTEFYDHLASHGWLGITTPEQYGGGGMGITEATLLLEAIAAGGGAMNAASSVHMTIFGMHPVIV